MTSAEGAKVAKAVKALNYTLRTHGEHMQEWEKLELRDAIKGIEGMVVGQIEKAEERITQARRWQSMFNDPNLQGELFDEKGRYLEDLEAKNAAKEKAKAEKQAAKPKKPSGSGTKTGNAAQTGATQVIDQGETRERDHYIDPNAGEQLPLDQSTTGSTTNANGTVMSWGLTPGIPEGVEMGLLTAVRDGSGQNKAIKLVAKEAKLTPIEVGGHWDTLVKKGRLYKDAATGHWMANLPSDTPTEATTG